MAGSQVTTIVSQNSLVHVFMGIAQLSRDTLQNGVSHGCARVKLWGARQRSGEGGVRRNGRPKRVFLESPFPLKVFMCFKSKP